jgi:hypothetical protein
MKHLQNFTCKSRITLIVAVLATFLNTGRAFSQTAVSDAKGEVSFVKVISTDETFNYLSLDLTMLPGFFERAYLLDLLFVDPQVVVNKTNISGPSLILFCERSHDLQLVFKSLDDYRLKALNAGKSITGSQREEFLKKYEKYR